MNWEDKPQVKKGNIGEALVEEYLLRKGIIPYRPIAKQAHPFDRLCASADKKRIYVAEVKAKPKREMYPDTGINIKNYHDYMHIVMQHSMDVFLYFVDEVRREIYGGDLLHLAEKRNVRHNGRLLEYPILQNGIIYFPLDAMEHIADIDVDACEKLQSLRRTNFQWAQK